MCLYTYITVTIKGYEAMNLRSRRATRGIGAMRGKLCKCSTYV